mmetsp:Transcript_12619/g.18553  ORF Transcript_12619/g.18553 Transcript_12619/m.18553 type:complete len:135 (-) Transcript_12619:120-524(-)
MQKAQKILLHDSDYRQLVVSDIFGDAYKVKWSSKNSNEAILEPKKQPSRVQATLFPMFKTRFKYGISFSAGGEVSHKDLLEITFNRSNGATVHQQERIFQNRKDFAALMKKMEQKIRMDQAQSDALRDAPSPAA